MSEFFNVNHFCADSQLGRAESTRRMIIALLIVLIILISSCIIGSILYFCFKPEHFTYLVNGKIRSNYNRDHLSYESLKRNENPPTQQQSNSVECKVCILILADVFSSFVHLIIKPSTNRLQLFSIYLFILSHSR